MAAVQHEKFPNSHPFLLLQSDAHIKKDTSDIISFHLHGRPQRLHPLPVHGLPRPWVLRLQVRVEVPPGHAQGLCHCGVNLGAGTLLGHEVVGLAEEVLNGALQRSIT